MTVDPNADHITADVVSTYVMTVPVGRFPVKTDPKKKELADIAPIPLPDVHNPYDILYICTGLIEFEFRPTGDNVRTGVLTEHGPGEIAGIVIRDVNRIPLSLVSPNSHQPMTIQDSAVTVSLARINNFSSDNGIWSVDLAELNPPQPPGSGPELSIQLSVRGDTDEIKFERVSYTAFIQTSPIT